jgi:hypothetical protein
VRRSGREGMATASVSCGPFVVLTRNSGRVSGWARAEAASKQAPRTNHANFVFEALRTEWFQELDELVSPNLP